MEETEIQKYYRERFKEVVPLLERGDQKEIMRLAGVSRGTLSPYLHGRGKQSKTARKILNAVKYIIEQKKPAEDATGF